MSDFEQTFFTKLVKLNSSARSSGTANNFRLHFNEIALNKVKRVSVRSVRFGNYQYNVTQRNNTFTLLTTLNGTQNITIPQGQYITTTLMTQIESIYNSLPATGKIDLVQNNLTGRLSLTMAGDTCSIGNGSINRILGFIRPSAIASASHVADVIPSLHGLTTVHVVSSKLAQGNLLKPVGDIGTQDVLIDVPISVPFGLINVWVEEIDSLSSVIYTHPRNLQDIDIALFDQDGNFVLLDESQEVEIFLKVYYTL